MDLALRLGKTLTEVQRGISSREFVLWKVFLEERLNEPEPIFWYLAQIACEVRRVLSRKPKELLIKDFVLEFSGPKKPKKLTPEQEELEKAKVNAASKSKWLGIFGFGGDK